MTTRYASRTTFGAVVLALAAALVLSACTTTERRAGKGALAGAAGGAIIGGIAGGGRGAAIGAAAGAATGALIGAATSPGDCRYRRRDGSIYIAPCPRR